MDNPSNINKDNSIAVQTFSKSKDTKEINILSNEDNSELENNPLLNLAIKKLPKNYNFEIYKSLRKIKEISNCINHKPLVALQFPDGLMVYSLLISDILSAFGECDCIILGDITYGACCIDDIGSSILNCDLLIHYAHSCLIPVTKSLIKTLYIFVEINFDIENLINTIKLNFPLNSEILSTTSPEEKKTISEQNIDYTIYLCGSIQYNTSLFACRRKLIQSGYSQNNIIIPQRKPRAMGEILGCTSPILSKKSDKTIVIFVCDGRFHMESLMIQNPDFTFYQYNPYTKLMTEEEYDLKLMKKIRFEQINILKNSKFVGIIFGTLGRQGDIEILERICNLLKNKKIEYVTILLNEITESKLENYNEKCECYIQLACPRLSIDWSSQFSRPMLTPFEAYVALDEKNSIKEEDNYSMDNYALNSGPWGHYPKKEEL